MFDLSRVKKYYVVAGYTDLRKGLVGLAAIVAGQYGQQLDDESLFLFCGRRANRIKGLYWTGEGFAVINYNLGAGRYQWPRNPPGLHQMTRDEFRNMITKDQNGLLPGYDSVCPYDLF